MIDTDKYEGHTEGPWKYYYDPKCDDWILKTSRYIHSGKGVRMREDLVDAQLIADAPLLLEEVKRLRNDMAYCASLITCMVDMGDPLSLSVVREGMLDSIGMTVDEAMATTDLMGDEQE